MDAEKFLGLYVYNECASMLPSCFYKANVSIHRTQIHEDNCAQRSNLVARPTFYRYGKPRAYKTVKHRDKSEERIQEEVCLEETRTGYTKTVRQLASLHNSLNKVKNIESYYIEH